MPRLPSRRWASWRPQNEQYDDEDCEGKKKGGRHVCGLSSRDLPKRSAVCKVKDGLDGRRMNWPLLSCRRFATRRTKSEAKNIPSAEQNIRKLIKMR